MAEGSGVNDGLVVAAHGQRGILETPEGKTISYLVKGKRLRVVCGDRVAWVRTKNSDDTAVL